MENQAPKELPTSTFMNFRFEVVVCFEFVILIGIIVVFLQFDGLPSRVAEQVGTPPDNSGQVYQLQQSVDQLTQQVSALQSSLDKVMPRQTRPAVSPSPSGR